MNESKGEAIRTAKGDYVIAIRDANKDQVNIFGCGVYVGDEPCPYLHDRLNPKIVLDDGNIVWGCECWWCNAEEFEREQLGSRKINIVPIKR